MGIEKKNMIVINDITTINSIRVKPFVDLKRRVVIEILKKGSSIG
ncbi:MAG: hypothetical protein R6U27_05365 [Desulfobacterales bacterium]